MRNVRGVTAFPKKNVLSKTQVAVAAFLLGVAFATPSFAEMGHWRLKGVVTEPTQDELDSAAGKDETQKIRAEFNPGSSGEGSLEASFKGHSRERANKRSQEYGVCEIKATFRFATGVEMRILEPGRKITFKTALTMEGSAPPKAMKESGEGYLQIVSGDEERGIFRAEARIGKTGVDQGDVEIPAGRPGASLTIEAWTIYSESDCSLFGKLRIDYEWVAGLPPAGLPAIEPASSKAAAAAAATSDCPAGPTDAAGVRRLDASQFGFSLRIPPGWICDTKSSDKDAALDWSAQTPRGPDGFPGSGLLYVGASVADKKPDIDPVASFRSEILQMLDNSGVQDFGPQQMGVLSGFAMTVAGSLKVNDTDLAIRARAFYFPIGERQRLLAIVAATPDAVALLDQAGQPGAVFGPYVPGGGENGQAVAPPSPGPQASSALPSPSPPSNPPQVAAAGGACMVASGEDRLALLDALRAPVASDLKAAVEFVVRRARICTDWAFALAGLQAPGGGRLQWRGTPCAGDTSHLVGGLLRKTEGRWRLIDYALCPSDVAWADWPDKYRAPASLFEE